MWIDVKDSKPNYEEFVIATNISLNNPSIYNCVYNMELDLFMMLGHSRNFKIPVVITHWMSDPIKLLKHSLSDDVVTPVTP